LLLIVGTSQLNYNTRGSAHSLRGPLDAYHHVNTPRLDLRVWFN